jgi:hypothetical protein
MKKLQACTDQQLEYLFDKCLERAKLHMAICHRVEAERDRRRAIVRGEIGEVIEFPPRQ